MRHLILAAAASFLMVNISLAQLFGGDSNFTRCDSIRGALSPERNCFDVKHYDLTVDIDPEERSIVGSNIILAAIKTSTKRIQLDLFEQFKIESVDVEKALTTAPGKINATIERDCQAFFINLSEPVNRGENIQITVKYSGKPNVAKRAPWDGGFVFKEDKQGNPWIGVACQGHGASSWWPNKDHLSDEPDDGMNINVIVPEELFAASNGNLIAEEVVEGNKKKYSWKVSYPINNYNVSVSIGNYVSFDEEYISKEDGEKMTMSYYVLPYNLSKAKNHFKQVAPMMDCFEKYLGKYPFYKDGFALIETPYLGMEHQSGIAYGNEYKSGYAGTDYSRIGLDFDYIIIHEAGHEWWGNNISVNDNADLWIHEGFCTYSEALYVECLHNYEVAMDYVNAKKPTIGNKKAILGPRDVNKEGSGDMYSKGMLILNTIRHVMDDDEKWFKIIKGLNEDFYHQTVDSKEIIDYINEVSGRDFTTIFKQYLEYPKIPVLETKLKGNKKKVKISYRWKTDVAGFDMPILVKSSGDEWEWIYPSNEWQSTKIKGISKSDFEVDQRRFYVEVK